MSSPSSGGIGTRFLLVSAAIVVIFAGLKAAQSLVSPFLLAVFFALILTPPLRWLKKKGLPDALAILALSTLVFMLGLGVVLVFSNSLTHFASKLPTYKEKVTSGYTTIDTWINNVADKLNSLGETLQQLSPITDFEDSESKSSPQKVFPSQSLPQQEHPGGFVSFSQGFIAPQEEEKGAIFATPTVEKWLTEELPTLKSERTEPASSPEVPSVRKKISLSDIIQVSTLFAYVQIGVNMLLNIATVSSLVIIMVVFMLIEAARLPDKVKEAFDGRDLSNEYFKKIADDTWNYMKIKTIICFLTGLATSIGLWFLGVEYAILWGLLMFFLNYIPNIGQVIASVPPILLALIDGGVVSATLVTAWLIFVNTAFGIGVEPRYLEHGLGISSLVVLLSLIFWGWLLGPVGMFLSAPLTMVIKIVLQNDPKTRWMAVLLSNR